MAPFNLLALTFGRNGIRQPQINLLINTQNQLESLFRQKISTDKNSRDSKMIKNRQINHIDLLRNLLVRVNYWKIYRGWICKELIGRRCNIRGFLSLKWTFLGIKSLKWDVIWAWTSIKTMKSYPMKKFKAFYKIEKELKELENMKSQMILNEINIYRTKRDILNAS